MKKMVSDLLSGVSPNSSGIIGENSELLSWEKDVAIIGCNNCVQHELEKHLFHNEIFPPLSIVFLQC